MKKKFRSLELIARSLINNFGSGSHISSLKDSTIDIDLIREYQPGDKKLDSKSSLKASRAMARVFSPEKMMTTYLVLDVSSSIYSKLDQAITTCLYLIYLTDLANDQIGLTTFSDKVHESTIPSHDSRIITPILEKIHEHELLSGSTNLEAALSKISKMELRNSLIVLISDFCYPLPDSLINSIKRVITGTNNKLIALALINQQEWSLSNKPFSVNFVDSESSKSTTWDFNSKNIDFYSQWLKELKIKLRQARVDPVLINVDKNDFLMPLVKYFLRD